MGALTAPPDPLGAEVAAPTPRWPMRLVLPIVVLSLLRLWLASVQMLTVLGLARHDDRLYMTLAQHLAAGRWLGPFDNLTLAKGPFYPMWIAASFIAGIPLMLSQNLLYLAACLVTILALTPAVRSSPGLVAIYAVLLFSPVMFAMTRVLRDAVYAPLTLLLAACLVGLFLRRARPWRSLASWAGGAGLALSAMWLTREDTLWILPSVLGLLAATALSPWRRGLDRLWPRTVILVSPLLIWGAAIAVISTINLLVYGAFVTTEVASGEWLAAYGALSRVEPDSQQRYVIVPRHVRERIYAASPAFAELRATIEGERGREWGSYGCEHLSVCNDIAAGWFMWMFRDAVEGAGYYRSAPMALAYYRRLAHEVNAACDAGTLRCGPPRATMAPRWRREYGPFVLHSFQRAVKQVVSFGEISPFIVPAPSVGPEPMLLPFRWLTRDRLTPTSDRRLRVDGWGFGVNGDLRYAVADRAGTPFEVTLRVRASPDVFAYFVTTEGRQFDRAREARFTLWTSCARDCRLIVRLGGHDRVLGTLRLEGGAGRLDTAELHLFVDTVTREDEVSRFFFGADAGKLNVLSGISRFYGPVGVVLTLVLIITLVVGTMVAVSSHRSIVLIPLLALVVAGVIRAALIALIDATSFPAVGSVYLSAVHSLLLLAGLLAGIELNGLRRAWLRKRTNQDDAEFDDGPSTSSPGGKEASRS